MARKTFDDLVNLMGTLRGPGGCPWDRQQSLDDLKPFIIEEAYEVVDAIDREDTAALREEVGDMLLEAVFVAQIAAEQGSFDIYDSTTHVHDKLVRRHPHVFADVQADTADAVLTNWEKMKNDERAAENKSLLSGVPGALPALLKATRLTEKAARVGFDWESTSDVLTKLDEESGELREAIARGDEQEILHELGDLLFTLANIARRLDVNAEEALQATNRKFIRRFQFIENELRQSSKTFDGSSLEELDALWDKAKEQGL
jgi:tetrapyrrole methylase family protein/MazG family protein